jgi:hypothetical protein
VKDDSQSTWKESVVPYSNVPPETTKENHGKNFLRLI